MIDPSGKSFVVCLVRDVLSIALGYLPQPRIAFPVVHSGRELIKSHSAALIRAVRPCAAGVICARSSPLALPAPVSARRTQWLA